MNVSPLRLRLGIILIFLWWIPFWLAAPFLAVIFRIDTPKSDGYLTIGVLAAQTVFGLAGLAFTGKEIASVVRHTSFKQMPGKVWHIVWSGKFDNPGEPVVKKS